MVARLGTPLCVTLASWALAALATGACGDGGGREDQGVLGLEAAACERLFECGCISIEGLDACSLGYSDAFGYDTQSPLVFDQACSDKWRAWIARASCDGPVVPTVDEVCPIYHGSIFAGLACDYGSAFETDCGPGLWCIAGMCIDPTGVRFGGPDELCDPLSGCQEGLACNEGRCAPLPGPGAPCPAGECADGARCEVSPDGATMLCVAGKEVGQPCMGHAECASFNCPAGFCSMPADVGDPCSSTLPCGPDLVCDGQVCVDLGGGLGGICGVFDVVVEPDVFEG